MAVIKKESHQTWIGTAAEMALFTSMLAGDKFITTDTKLEYEYTGADWIIKSTGVQLSGSIVETSTVATAGITSGVALAANANRKYARFINDSDNTIYLKIGAAAVLNQGIRLNANGGSYEMSAATGNLDLRAVYCITTLAGQNLIVGEGV